MLPIHLVIAGIVPAAGRSRRMGADKALLDIGGRPMLLGVIDALMQAGIGDVTLVLNSATLARLGEMPCPAVRHAINDDATSEMIDSVRVGLRAAGSAGPSGYLVCPCDAAGIRASDVRRCVEAFLEAPDRIVVATYAGRRGHPMLFPVALAGAVQSAECDGGLNHLLRNRPQIVQEVPCESPGTVANVNTPADYERLRDL
jgi:CTP:molybdopterin cytidylyltransferase MocA